MSYLLDPHALIWFAQSPEKISRTAYRLIAESDEPNYFSIASIWEIAIKTSPGKLWLDADVGEFARSQLRNAFQLLPVSLAHPAQITKLPPHHRDPFNRMLIAQALSENLTIITADKNFKNIAV